MLRQHVFTTKQGTFCMTMVLVNGAPAVKVVRVGKPPEQKSAGAVKRPKKYFGLD